MQNVQKRNLQLCMQKIHQNVLYFSENPLFCFWNVDILSCKRFEQFCNSRMSEPVIQKAFLKRLLQFLIKVPQMTAMLSKSKNLQFLTFLATSRNFKEDLIG